MIDYQLIRSARRKTLSLQVKQGRVFVRAPNFVDLPFIEAFLQKKSTWLENKVLAQRNAAVRCCDFSSGANIYYLGEKITLAVSQAKRSNVSLNINDEKHSAILQVNVSDRISAKHTNKNPLAYSVKKLLEAYFKEQAQAVMLPRIKNLSEQTQLFANNINIRQYRARWGSCNSRKEVSLNYLLMMVPLWVIDYVIIHELCHLIHLNHSAKFWALVKLHCPNYLDAKQWLVQHQTELYWSIP